MNFIFPAGILHGLKCLTSKKETQNLSQMQRQHSTTPVSILLSMERNQGKAEQLQLRGLKAEFKHLSLHHSSMFLGCQNRQKVCSLSHIQKAKRLPGTVYIYFIQAGKYRVAINTQVNTLSVCLYWSLRSAIRGLIALDQGTNPPHLNLGLSVIEKHNSWLWFSHFLT